MKSWFTAAELAGLPGLPDSKRGVNKFLKTIAVESRPRAARGGGREYFLDSLPEDARRYLFAKGKQSHAELVPAIIEPKPPALSEPPPICELKDWQRQVMEARLAVLALVDRLGATRGERHAITEVLALAEQGLLPEDVAAQIPVANARASGAPRLSRATLYSWLKCRSDYGPTGLAPASGKHAAMPAWLTPLLALYQRPQKPPIAKCLRDWPLTYPDQPAPAERTANRWIDKLPVEVREFGRLGPAAMRAVQPFVRRTTDGLWPMDIVTVDGHLFKAYVRHPATGQKLRPELTTYLDVATRRAVGFSAWIAESQYAIWIALRNMVLTPDCGIPALHYSDNGAYRGERHRAILARLGTTPMFSQAYRAQARGLIERFNSSVWIPLARDLPTYCGDDADPEHLKCALAIANNDGGNLPGWADFIDTCRRALEAYNNRAHGGIGKRTPGEAWAQAVSEGWRPTPIEADNMHDLLPAAERVVRRGEVRLPWGRYFHHDLALHHGRPVRVAFDPTDGARAWVSEPDGRLICIAERDANARPYEHESQLAHGRAQREAGRVLRLEKKLDAVYEEGQMQIEQMPAESLTPVPIPSGGAEIVPIKRNLITSAEDDPRRNYTLWLHVEAALIAGERVSTHDQQFHAGYQHSSEYESMKKFFREFETDLDADWRSLSDTGRTL